MRNRVFWIGVFAGVVASLLIGLLVVPALGFLDMSATGGAGPLDWWGELSLESSLFWRAPDSVVPTTADADEGLEHFKASCLQCHGAPGIPPAEWAQQMLPEPPELWQEDTQEMSDGAVFRVVQQGVRMTGMPAFGPDHTEAELWNIVAFVRQLNLLTDNQKQQLQQAAQVYQEHHGQNQHGVGEKQPQDGGHAATAAEELSHPHKESEKAQP